MFKKLLKSGQHNNATSLALLFFRVTFSLAMLTHGYGKFMKVMNGNWKFGDPLGIGVHASLISASFAEFICSILVILGLTTRYALIPLIFTMLVAWQLVHGGDPFGSQEKSVLYLVAYVTLFITGPGNYSIDRQLFGR